MIFLQFVTVSSRGAALAPGAARALARFLLRRSGRALWLRAYIDAFTAPGASLYVFRPAVSVAPWAIPVIHKYFTE